jgi:hypothetical protein
VIRSSCDSCDGSVRGRTEENSECHMSGLNPGPSMNTTDLRYLSPIGLGAYLLAMHFFVAEMRVLKVIIACTMWRFASDVIPCSDD